VLDREAETSHENGGDLNRFSLRTPAHVASWSVDLNSQARRVEAERRVLIAAGCAGGGTRDSLSHRRSSSGAATRVRSTRVWRSSSAGK
jgi:hypothetical protein